MCETQYSLNRDDDHPDNHSEFSGLFAPIFVCPEHGETWHVESGDIVDTENDDVYHIDLCARCHKPVTRLLHDGAPVMHPLTSEEAYWESYTGDDETDWDEEDW